MDIDKGAQHQKIIGDYGEMLICNWLSRSGFYDRMYRGEGKAIDGWKMTKRHKRAYADDANVKHIHVAFAPGAWFCIHRARIR